MTYHYGSSSSSQRSSTSSSSQRTATGTGQSTPIERAPAPPGFHYMPDGTLMSDEEHARLYSTPSGSTMLNADMGPVEFEPVGTPSLCSLNDFKDAAILHIKPMLEVLNPNQSPSYIQQLLADFVAVQHDHYVTFKCNGWLNQLIGWHQDLIGAIGQAAVQLEAYVAFGEMMYSKCGCTQGPQAKIIVSAEEQEKQIKLKEKLITGFSMDYSDLNSTGETRRFTISGDSGAEFKIEVKDKDTGKYYNFYTKLFQTDYYCLEGEINLTSYSDFVIFPAVTGSDDQYDINIYARPGTKHVVTDNFSRRFKDGTIDINSSANQSDPYLIQKVIYQYADVTLTLSGYSSSSGVTGTFSTQDIAVSRGKNKEEVSFSLTVTSSLTSAYRILRQPLSSDVIAFLSPTLSSVGLALPGEDIYNYTARSSNKVVNGDFSGGATNITMDDNVADIMAIGDRVTGNAVLDAKTGDAAVTVTAIDVGGDVKVFTLSESIAINDDETLNFTQPRYRRWEVDNFADIITEGMVVVPGSGATSILSGTTIAEYEDFTLIDENTPRETKIRTRIYPAVDATKKKPTISKGVITTQEGEIIFNQGQNLAVGGTAIKVGGYGEELIKNVYGYEVVFSDLAVALTKPTTTTTSTISNTTIAVADTEGVINNVSRLSGIGIDPSVQSPLITGGGGTDGSGNWTVDAAQNLESGITLTVENTGRTATITGKILIKKAGNADRTLRIDVDNILSMSA